MPLTFCILASGSSGNCTYVASATTRILVDAGLSQRETVRRLAGAGLLPPGADSLASQLEGICITHEHRDHNAGLDVLGRRTAIPFYANSGTIEALEHYGLAKGRAWQVFTSGQPFRIGDLEVLPFSVPHDAYDPVGFVVRHADAALGIATDIGMPTTAIRQYLRGCRTVILEANHDRDLLHHADRPWALKQRIAGRQGHLSNQQAAELAVELAPHGLRHVVLSHLSAECNEPALALRTVREALAAAGFPAVEISLAHPRQPTAVHTVE